MADPWGIAMSQRAETKRDSKTGEHLAGEDRPETAAGNRNEQLLEQKQILDLTNTPNGSDKVVGDDEWGESTVVPKKPWVDCPCGDLVENRDDTLCEPCKILGVRTPGISREKLERRESDLNGTNKCYPNLSGKCEEDYEIERTRKGIIESRGDEAERKSRGRDERVESARVRDGNLSSEGSADRSSSRLILDLTNTPTVSEKIAEDEEWGSCTVVPREPWVDCQCENPVENRGDTLCEVCRVLGVWRGAELKRLGRSGQGIETELYTESPGDNEWYDSERKERRTKDCAVEPTDSEVDGNHSSVAARTETNDQANDEGKGKKDLSNKKERHLFDIPSNVFDEAEPTLLRAEELSPEMRMKLQTSWAENSLGRMSMTSFEGREMMGAQAPFGSATAIRTPCHPAPERTMEERMTRHFDLAQNPEDDTRKRATRFGQSKKTKSVAPKQILQFQLQLCNGMAISRGDGIDVREAGFALQRYPTLYKDLDPPPEGSDTSASKQHSGTLPTERPSLVERLAKAKSERQRAAAAGEVEPPRPRPSVSFQPFRGMAESREVPVYQRFGKERSSNTEEYERWRAEAEEEQLEKDRQNMVSLKATSRYASNFRPARERRQAMPALANGGILALDLSLDPSTEDGGARGRNETAMIPIVKDETEELECQPRAQPGSTSIKISHEQAFNELWRQLCATNGLDSNDETLKNLHESRLRKISNQRRRCFMWYDWRAWDKDEESSQEPQTENYDYTRPRRCPSPDAIAEGRAVWDGRMMHSGTSWWNAVQFSEMGRYDQGSPYTLFVPRRKVYGPKCDICVKRKFSCDGMRPKCELCTRIDHDCVALIGSRCSSVELMKVEIAREKVAKAAEELESYRLPNSDKDNLDQEEAWLVQAHDQAKIRHEQLETSLTEREESMKNLNEGSHSGWEHRTADSDSRSFYRGGECREDDKEHVMWYSRPARVDFDPPAWSDKEQEGLCKDHRKPSSFVAHEKEVASDGNQDISSRPDGETAHKEHLRRESSLNARKEAVGAAEEYKSYRPTVWGNGGFDRKEVDLRQKVEMAETLLERLKREERPKVPQNEVGSKDQLGEKVHHRGSAQSRAVPICDRDTVTRNAVSREAALRREYEANCQRGVAPSRESEARRRNEEETARQHRAFRLEELAKMKEFKQWQQEHLGDNNDGFRSRSTVGTESAAKMAVRGPDETISARGRAVTVEDEDELETRLEGLVLGTRVQVPEAMRLAMEKDGEWRSFA